MRPAFLTPMFDHRASVAGIPTDVAVLVLAGIGLTVGAVAILRIFRGTPEPRSFRATDPEHSILPLVRG